MKKKLKILWSSVSPTIESGYGRVTNEVCKRLIARGYDVINHGYQTSGRKHKVDDTFEMLESGGPNYGMNVLRKYFTKYNRDVLITLYDVWAFFGKVEGLCLPWIAYFPIDAEPVTVPLSVPLSHAMKRITLSEFGKREVEKTGLSCEIIYHGVDTKVYKPLSEEDKKEFRKKIGIPENAFVVGTNGANNFDRKDFPRMIRIFSEFVKRNNAKDALFYIHTDPKGEPGRSYSMVELGRLYGVADQLRYPPYRPFNNEMMVKMYNTLDVYFSASRAEGCGMPILEAQACGVPCIVADNSAQPEWIKDHGWVVPCTDHIVTLTTPLHNKWYLMDIEEGVKALTEAYENREKLKELGKKSYEAMQDYDWDKIVDEQWIPMLEQAAEQLENPYGAEYFGKRDKQDMTQNFDQIMEEVKATGSKSVLEVGCGSGQFIEYLQKKGIAASGFDISATAVEKANEKQLGVEKADAVKGLKKYDDNTFDTVCSMHLLEHCENDMEVILQSIRVASKFAMHLIPIGTRADWTHKRVYDLASVLERLKPSKMLLYANGDALLIYEKVEPGKK